MLDSATFLAQWPIWAAALGFGYALGSIPFGLLLTRMAGLGDVRSIGSGNIGATNVLRTGRKGLAAATLAGDALKGTAAAVVAGQVAGPEACIIAGFGAFLGHIFPVWLGFRGGKGVATFIGILLGLHWPSMLLFAVVWLAVAYLARLSSLAALTAVLVVPLASWIGPGFGFPQDPKLAAVLAILTVLIYVKHHANIRRLLAGTEPRIGAGGKAEEPAGPTTTA